ncbi:MAG: hypothetical protein IJO52_07390, partial [Clostridia bacterium]|nr:hypothetical protein [Clostridia bacterium]
VPTELPDDSGELVDPPKTGDTSNILLWIVVMIVSVLVILIAILLIKRAVGKDKPNKTAKHFTFGIITILILMICLVLTTYALVYDYVMVEENIFRTGVVEINLNDGDAITQADEHRFEPGVTVVKDFFIENLSSSDVYYRLYLDNMDGDLGDFLEITIKDGERVLFHGKPAQLTKLNFEADTLYLDEKRWLTCTFHFPVSEDNDGESRDMGFNLCAEAVQTKNNPDKVFE